MGPSRSSVRSKIWPRAWVCMLRLPPVPRSLYQRQLRASPDTAITDLDSPLDDSPPDVEREDKLLVELCRKCSGTASEIRRQIAKLKRDAKRGVLDIVTKTIQSMRKSKFIEEKKKELEGYERVLNTRILIRLDARAIQQTQMFEKLLERMDKLSLDISNPSEHSRDATRTIFYQNMMKSLHFPEICSRQEQIPSTHRDTFEWIFNGIKDEGNEAKEDNDKEKEGEEGGKENEEEKETGRPGSATTAKVNGLKDHTGSKVDGLKDGELGEREKARSKNLGDSESSESIRPDDDKIHPWANFSKWLSFERGTYWVSGKAGSGKSTLMSFIVQDPRTNEALKVWAQPDLNVLTPSFFFWESGTPMQKSINGLLRSLIYQILDSDPGLLGQQEQLSIGTTSLNDQVEILNAPSLHTWTERRLLAALKLVLDAAERARTCFCFFIDGLDEFVGDTEILKDIISILSDGNRSKICVSSRPKPVFLHHFAEVPQLRLQDLTSKDIKTYVDDRLGPVLAQAIQNDSFRDSFRDSYRDARDPTRTLLREIQNKAAGVFLWITIVVQNMLLGIRNGDTLPELWQTLEDLPPDLEKLYSHMLRKIPKHYLAEAVPYFELLIAAHGQWNWYPLTVLDLALSKEQVWTGMIADEDNRLQLSKLLEICNGLDNRVISRCAGLVHVSEQESPWRCFEDAACVDKSEFARRTIDALEAASLLPYFRSVNLIHKSVIEFLTSKDALALSVSRERGLVPLARTHIARGTLFSEMIPRSPYEGYIATSGLTARLGSLLSLMDNKVAIEAAKGAEAQAIDDLIQQALPLLDSIHHRLNPQENKWLCMEQNFTNYNDSFFVLNRVTDCCDKGLPLRDELSLWAFWGLDCSLQRREATIMSSFDWGHILLCALYGLCNFPFLTTESFLKIVIRSLTNGAKLDKKIQSVRTLPGAWVGISSYYTHFPMIQSFTALTATLAMLWGDKSCRGGQRIQSQRREITEVLLGNAPASTHTLFRFSNVTKCIGRGSEASEAIKSRIKELSKDLIFYELSLLAFFEDIVNTGKESDKVADANIFKDKLAKQGSPSSIRFSLYACFEPETSADSWIHTVVYRLDEEQMSLLSNLDCIHLLDFGTEVISYANWTAHPLLRNQRQDECNSTLWASSHVEQILDTIKRVKKSLREEQIVGHTKSGRFIFGDESTYMEPRKEADGGCKENESAHPEDGTAEKEFNKIRQAEATLFSKQMAEGRRPWAMGRWHDSIDDIDPEWT